MTLTINGEAREVDDSVSTIADFLSSKQIKPEMVVVEHNGAIIPRPAYAATTLAVNDSLEIVQMMAGG